MSENNTKKPLIIAGPCSVESRQQLTDTYSALAAAGMVDMIRGGVWKPRTRPGHFQGVGEVGLEWLAEAKAATGLPFGVEVANAAHTEKALKHGADMVWIGTRTTVNPFNVEEIAEALCGTDVLVMIKNAPMPDTGLWSGAVERISQAGIPAEKIILIHRGFVQSSDSSFRNPPAWHIALEMRRRFPELRMLCDPSHICGERTHLHEISQKAADLSYDGLFIESHINPASALSDAGQQLTPEELSTLLTSIKWRREKANHPEFERELERYRLEIDQIDSELFGLLSRRMKIAEGIGLIKRDNNVTILQRKRWEELMEKMLHCAASLDLNTEFVKAILDAIHLESIAHQNKVMNPEAGQEEK